MTQANLAFPAVDFETIFRHAPVGMCVSQQRVITACNEALAAIFGYQTDQLCGQSFSILYPSASGIQSRLPTLSLSLQTLRTIWFLPGFRLGRSS